MAFHVTREVRDESRVPRLLSKDLPEWRRSDAVRVRDFSFRAGRTHGRHSWLIDGLPFAPAAVTSSTATTPNTRTWE